MSHKASVYRHDARIPQPGSAVFCVVIQLWEQPAGRSLRHQSSLQKIALQCS